MEGTPPPDPPKPPLTVLGELGVALAKSEQTVSRLETTLRDERANQKRFHWTLGGLLLLSLLHLLGLGLILNVQKDAKGVADTLEDCLVVGGACYEDLARNGQLGSNRLMDFNGCMFLIEPTARQTKDVEVCKKEANEAFFKALDEAQEVKK